MTRPTTVIIAVLILAVLFLVFDLHQKTKQNLSYQETIDSNSQAEQNGRHSVLQQEYPTVIYNRVPKTGSTAFTQIAYKLVKENQMYVLHVNTSVHSKNAAIMTIQDRQHMIKNITNFEHSPAFFHGHFAFLPFPEPKPVYINLIRDPLDRLVSYYYFLRHGDNFRKGLARSKQGDLTTFDECVKSSLSKDCSISKMWMQIPYFCGQLAPCWDTGSQWALERAKLNLVNEYFLVGMNEQMGQFVEMLEVHVPHIFKGGSAVYKSQDPIRVTNHKDPISEETKKILSNTKVWRMEYDFYNFAKKIFDQEYTNTFHDGEVKSKGYFYEKVYGPSGKITK